jgi:hypothetical protein
MTTLTTNATYAPVLNSHIMVDGHRRLEEKPAVDLWDVLALDETTFTASIVERKHIENLSLVRFDFQNVNGKTEGFECEDGITREIGGYLSIDLNSSNGKVLDFIATLNLTGDVMVDDDSDAFNTTEATDED